MRRRIEPRYPLMRAATAAAQPPISRRPPAPEYCRRVKSRYGRPANAPTAAPERRRPGLSKNRVGTSGQFSEVNRHTGLARVETAEPVHTHPLLTTDYSHALHNKAYTCRVQPLSLGGPRFDFRHLRHCGGRPRQPRCGDAIYSQRIRHEQRRGRRPDKPVPSRLCPGADS